MTTIQWLDWAKKIQAISQAGLAFSKDVYDRERYEKLRALSVEILAHYTELDSSKIQDLFTNDTGYQTPKVDVRGVVFQNNQILLVRENEDGKWALPGGFCDIGLSPTENVTKEIFEESGFQVKTTRLLALFDKNKHLHPPDAYHYYKLFILCEIIGGKSEIGIETNCVQFFAEDDLPSLSTHRNTASQLNMMFEFLKNPAKETIID